MSNENFAISLEDVEGGEQLKEDVDAVSYTHLTLPTTPNV